MVRLRAYIRKSVSGKLHCLRGVFLFGSFYHHMNTSIDRLVLPPTVSAPFILEVVKDAVLLVDKEKFIFANRAFEEMFDYAWCVIAPQHTTTVMLSAERARFFQLVSCLIDGEQIFNEALVDCMHQYTGPFLSKVNFYPFIDMLDNKHKCVCIFSDPLFYKKILEKTATLICLLEYFPEEQVRVDPEKHNYNSITNDAYVNAAANIIFFGFRTVEYFEQIRPHITCWASGAYQITLKGKARASA